MIAGILLGLCWVLDPDNDIYEPFASVALAVFTVIQLLQAEGVLSVPPSKFPSGHQFVGITHLTEETAWSSPEQEQAVIDRLEQRDSHGLLIVTGPSGAGKSTLMHARVIPRLRRSGWKSPKEPIRQYDNVPALQSYLAKWINSRTGLSSDEFTGLTFDPAAITSDVRSLLLFDQAEQMLLMDRKDLQWVISAINLIKQVEGVRVAMLVRDDYYLRLRLLGHMLSAPRDVVWLPGFTLTSDARLSLEGKLQNGIVKATSVPSILQDFTNTILDVDSPRLQGEITLKSVPVIIPSELQVVGAMLETKTATSDSIDSDTYFQKYGAKEGLIRDFFRSALHSSPSFRVSQSVLCALSARGAIRSPVSLSSITRTTYYSQREVLECLQVFQERRLVAEVSTPSGKGYQWVHDWLAIAYRDYSAIDMDAITRDNINYLVDRIQSRRLVETATASSSEVLGRRIVLGVLGGLCVCAIVIRVVLGIVFGGDQPARGSALWLVDNETSYLPVALAHFPWAVFVYRFLHIVVRLRTRMQLVFTSLIAGVGIASLCGSMLWPKTWLMAVGVTGIAVWACLVWLNRDRGLSPEARRRVRVFATSALGVSAISIAGGIVFQVAWMPGMPYAGVVHFAFAAIVAICGCVAIERHGTLDAEARWLGILSRRHSSM